MNDDDRLAYGACLAVLASLAMWLVLAWLVIQLGRRVLPL